MPRWQTALLSGIAALGIAAGAATAQTINVMTVPAPGGGLAEIRYVGDVPPQVRFVPAPAAFAGWAPAFPAFGSDSPFAMLDRIAAEMDRRAAAMFRYAQAAADRARSGALSETGFGRLPPGSQGYSFISTMSGDGVCMRGVRITSVGDGAPRVERYSSGDCAPSATRPAAPARPAPARQPDLILTQNTGAYPHAGMVRQVAAIGR